MYRFPQERSDVTVSLTEHLIDIYKSNLSKQWQIDLSKLYSEHFTYLENAIYRVLLERSNISASFADHLKFYKSDFYSCSYFGWIVKNQKNIYTIRTLYIFKMLYLSAPPKKQYRCFFLGAPNNSRINVFYIYTSAK